MATEFLLQQDPEKEGLSSGSTGGIARGFSFAIGSLIQAMTSLPRGARLINEALRKTLKQLRLSGLLESLEIRLQEAAGHGLSHSEFLELILQDELAVRADR